MNAPNPTAARRPHFTRKVKRGLAAITQMLTPDFIVMNTGAALADAEAACSYIAKTLAYAEHPATQKRRDARNRYAKTRREANA